MGNRKKNKQTMQKILIFVKNYEFEFRKTPSLQNIASGVGIAKSTVHNYLTEMHEKGLLSYQTKQIRLPGENKNHLRSVRVPIVGNIVCGTPELAEENFEEYVPLPTAIFGNDGLFILRAHGDSMVEAGISSGDLVVVKKQSVAEAGDIVVALVDNETTLKTYYPDPENHCVRLHPENRAMKDIIVPECYIQGIARHIIKRI